MMLGPHITGGSPVTSCITWAMISASCLLRSSGIAAINSSTDALVGLVFESLIAPSFQKPGTKGGTAYTASQSPYVRRITAMCGRYVIEWLPDEISERFQLRRIPASLFASFNAAPTQELPTVVQTTDGERELVTMRWGLVPRWAKRGSKGP